jgi:hypothetical protein
MKPKAESRTTWDSFCEAFAGDAERARETLWQIASAIRESSSNNWWREIAAEMLERVAVGEDANISLMVKRERKRPNNLRTYKHRVFLRVNELLETGITRKAACERVAKKENREYPRMPSGRNKPVTWRAVEDTYLQVEREYRDLVEVHSGRPTLTVTAEDFADLDLDALRGKEAESRERYALTLRRVSDFADRALGTEK